MLCVFSQAVPVRGPLFAVCVGRAGVWVGLATATCRAWALWLCLRSWVTRAGLVPAGRASKVGNGGMIVERLGCIGAMVFVRALRPVVGYASMLLRTARCVWSLGLVPHRYLVNIGVEFQFETARVFRGVLRACWRVFGYAVVLLRTAFGVWLSWSGRRLGEVAVLVPLQLIGSMSFRVEAA